MLCEEVTRTLSGGPYRSQGSSPVAAPKGPVCPGNETESQLCQVFNGGDDDPPAEAPPVLPEARQVAEKREGCVADDLPGGLALGLPWSRWVPISQRDGVHAPTKPELWSPLPTTLQERGTAAERKRATETNTCIGVLC